MFTGNYERTLDGKGRLVLPPKYRTKLPEGGYLAPLGDHLGLYPSQEFEDMLERVTERVRNGEVDQDALFGLASLAEEVQVDGQGRVGLPPRLRAKAGLDDNNEVVVVGAVKYVQIWNAARWAERQEAIETSAAAAIAAGKTL
ncbi:MAG TPA: hypothetical protein VF183_01250 [Acidimicrobiales bacterium]